jgi:hypothetical protein
MRNDKKIILRVGGKKKTFTSYVNDLLFIGDNLYPLMFGLFYSKFACRYNGDMFKRTAGFTKPN